MSKNKGNWAEEKAKEYLMTQGLRWIASNYFCRLGEVDLVMQDEDCLVFIEVRLRSSFVFGVAAESVTLSKQKKLVKTALHFLMAYKKYSTLPIRFDVVSFDGNPVRMNWIKNAIQSD